MNRKRKALVFAAVIAGAALPARAADGLRQLAASSLEETAAPAPSAPERLGGGGAPAWPAGNFAAEAGKAYRALPNYITIHAIPSPHPINWKSAGTLIASYARNMAAVKLRGQTHSIGHVEFEIGCTLPDGKRDVLLTGQTTKEKGGMSGFIDQVKAGYGYSPFFGYVPGRLETREDLEREMDGLSNAAGEVGFMTFKVSRESCLEALRYIRAYHDEGVDTRYGLGVRPLYKEGGGCANVGASVLEVAGPSDFTALAAGWHRTFYIPKDLMGGPDKKIGLGKIIRFWGHDWTQVPAGPYRELFFYDPDLMYNWVTAAYKSGAYPTYEINKSPGVLLDYSNASAPTPWWRSDR